MRPFLLILFLCMSVNLISCSSNEIRDTKIKVAKELGEETESHLLELYDDRAECRSEAAEIGSKFEGKILEFLRVEKDQEQAHASVAGPAKSLCEFVASQVLPRVIEQSGDSYVCLREVGASYASEMASKLCQKIDP